jgi:biopolymer transport protein ExbD
VHRAEVKIRVARSVPIEVKKAEDCSGDKQPTPVGFDSLQQKGKTMRFSTRRGMAEAKADMTPMIDMTFQLIAFFMVIVNFSEGDRNERIRLPISELAKPPDAPLKSPITLHLTEQGTVIFGPDEVTIPSVERLLMRERKFLESRGENPNAATVVIRGDRAAKTGQVQELIRVCQKVGFERFVLRARQEFASLTQLAGGG